ncbi:MAG: hypothetical protein H0W09_08055, partial [Solirubrobacterales bacterium]|nr:hypothetical protein [Solirubrobacterales bacterium]
EIARFAADRARGRPVWWLGDLASAERWLPARLRDGDLLATIGAGDVFRLAEALVTELPGQGELEIKPGQRPRPEPTSPFESGDG